MKKDSMCWACMNLREMKYVYKYNILAENFEGKETNSKT